MKGNAQNQLPAGAGGKPNEHEDNPDANLVNVTKAIHKQLQAAEQENNRRDNRHFKVEIAAIIIATVYASATIALWFLTRHSIDVSQHDFEVAHGANVVPGYPDDFVLQRGKDSKFTFVYHNAGSTQASLVQVVRENHVIGREEPETFSFGCFARRDDAYIYPGLQNARRPDTTIRADDLRPEKIEKILSGELILRAYIMILYWNQFCLRCVSNCFQFGPRENSAADPDVIRGAAQECPTRPNCSRFDKHYNDPLTCLSSDVSSQYRYYPESDDNGIKFGKCGIPEAANVERLDLLRPNQPTPED